MSWRLWPLAEEAADTIRFERRYREKAAVLGRERR
jgi:hypothetical protein